MTIQELFKWVENFNTQDQQAETETTEAYIERLLDTYYKELNAMSSPVGASVDWLSFLTDIDSLNKVILECLDLYSQAKIAESISKFHDVLRAKTSLLTLTVDPAKVDDKNWYRMRLQEDEKRVFPANEMFHIPFNLRHKVSLARYSVSGYPCLYISRSVLATWEEMHEPKLSDFSVSRLELLEPIKVLDLRVPVWQDNYSDQDLLNHLYSIPLVLACSVKVKFPKDNFKPEYIIPQLVMLAIAYSDVPYMGCAYTSTRRNPIFTWPDIRLLDNIALPVKVVNQNQKLCPMLCSMFKVSDSTNYDYELLKKPFNSLFWTYIGEGLKVDEAQDYKNSVFGQIEERLRKMITKALP
jgi:hypothetical protein